MLAVERLLAEGLLTPLSDAELKICIGTLNERFTVGRHQLAGYGEDPRLVSAYAAWYLPTNMKKLPFVLSQIPGFPISMATLSNAPFEIVDFGCGPGTYGFAMYEWLQAHRAPTADGADTPILFHFIDAAATMLRQAQKIQQTLYPAMCATFGNTVPPSRDGVRRLILFGNVVNEMGVDTFESLRAGLDADVMIFIEPGTPASFRQMAALRASLLQDGYTVLYPCASGDRCPLAGNGDEWCHQVLKASLEPVIGRIGQIVGLDRTTMPFIGHVYAKQSPSVDRAVLFRLKTHSKHAFFWEVCVATAAGLEIKRVELPKKHYSKAAQKSLTRISAGQRIGFSIQKELGNGAWRIENVNLR